MSTRKVTLKVSTQKDLIVNETAARTFGELRKELSDVKWDGMRVVERSTKVTYQADDAVLPATDFVLFLVPEKVKAGAFNVETATYNDLRSKISTINRTQNTNIPLEGKSEDLRSRLRDYFNTQDTPEELKAVSEEEDTQDMVSKLKSLKTGIGEALDTLIDIYENKSQAEEIAFMTTMQELEDEIFNVKMSLKL